MNDRELLEVVAKMVGIDADFKDYDHFDCAFIDNGDAPWNPLTDDGDAMGLAVKLEIVTYWVADQAYATSAAGCCAERYGDKAAATRRAIVRAVAQFDKSEPMKLLIRGLLVGAPMRKP